MMRFVVIGSGAIADRYRRLLKSIEPRSVIGSCTSRLGKFSSAPAETDTILCDIEQIKDFNPELVINASPAVLHYDLSIPFIHDGIPILIEKPLAGSLVDAKKILEASMNAKARVSVAYVLRYLDSIRRVQGLIEKGVLGDTFNIICVAGQFLPLWRPKINYKNSVSANKKLGGGVLLEFSHEIDYLGCIFGELKLLYSTLRKTGTLATDVEEIADLVFQGEHNELINLHIDFYMQPPVRKFDIYGELGNIECDIIRDTVRWFYADGCQTFVGRKSVESDYAYREMLVDILENPQMNHTEIDNIKRACRTIELIEQCKEGG